MESLVQDIRQSVRHLRTQPGVALVAIVSLAIGIGVNSAIFSVLDAMLFRPPALRNLDRMVVVYHRSPGSGDRGTSFPAFELYRQRTDVFRTAMAVAGARPLVLTDGPRRDQVYAELATTAYFAMTAIRLQLGVPFPADADRTAGTSHVIVLSHAFWTRRFNADPAIVGTPVMLNGQPFTVAGVAAEGFTGLNAEVSADMWMPITTWASLVSERHRLTSDEHWVTTIAELSPNVSLDQARAAMAVAGQALATSNGQETMVRAAADGLHGVGLTDAFAIAGAAFAVGLIVLALACTNVANLLMARAAARQHEMAVRLALGSGRVRLVRLWMSDSLILSCCAAALGLLVAWWLLSALAVFKPPVLDVGQPEAPSLPLDFHLDVRVFAFTFALAAVTALVVGLLSGLQASRGVTLARLQTSRGSSRRFAPGFNLRSASIALQMALSTILLIPCGLFVRSALRTLDAQPGFDVAGVHLLPIADDQSGVKVQKPEGFERDLAARVRQLPGVVAATVMDPVPLWFGGRFGGYRIEGQGTVRAGHASVGLQYFATMRIPLLAGRDFETADTSTSPAVAIVNETLARRIAPDGDVVGRRVRDWDESVEIVGVARDAKYLSLSETSQPWVYRPISQFPSSNTALSLAVRTPADPEAMRSAIAREVKALVPNWPHFAFHTLDEGLRVQHELPRLAATLLGALGLFGLFLATLGIYGVMTFVVRQRRQEIGIRLALGAQVAHVVGLVVRQGMAICVTGAALGIAVALAIAQFLASALHGVGGPDLATCIAVPMILMSIALLACYLPTRGIARLTRLRTGE
jgi:predicted permease